MSSRFLNAAGAAAIAAMLGLSTQTSSAQITFPWERSQQGAPQGQVQSDDADLEMRIQRLESQLRQLTGQNEELQFRNRQLEERLAFGPAYQDRGVVFCREDGEPIHPEQLSRLFRRHVAAVGLPAIRLHDLRHTHASLLMAAGVHPKVVQERLGHHSSAFTMDTYAHVGASLQAQAAAAFADLLGG